MNELEVVEHVQALADKNLNTVNYDCYLGAGYYDHYQPAAVKHLSAIRVPDIVYSLSSRSRENSSGIFQIAELYHARLTGLPIANAGLYDCLGRCR